MNVKIKNGKLVVELDLHDAKPSTSGKTLGVAGTQGRLQTSATIDGHPVWLIANAFIYPTSAAKNERESEESQSKGRKAAVKPTSSKSKRVTHQEDDIEEEDEGDEN